MQLGISIGLCASLGQGLVGDAFALSPVDGEAVITGASGVVEITITAPAAYAGSYTVTVADLTAGPVNLVPPVVLHDGTPSQGEELRMTPGLWVYDPDVGGLGVPSYQWQSDTAGDGLFADISGALMNAWFLTASEAGDQVRAVEILSDNGGTRSIASAPVSVAATGAAVERFADDFTTHAALADLATTSANWQALYQNQAAFLADGAGLAYFEALADHGAAEIAHTGTLADDQYAEAIFDSTSGSDARSVAVRVRMSGSDGFQAYYDHLNGELHLAEIGGTTANQVISPFALATGDTLRLEVIGMEASVFHNGLIVGTHILDTLTSGQAGLSAYLRYTGNAVYLQSFACGDVL